LKVRKIHPTATFNYFVAVITSLEDKPQKQQMLSSTNQWPMDICHD